MCHFGMFVSPIDLFDVVGFMQLFNVECIVFIHIHTCIRTFIHCVNPVFLVLHFLWLFPRTFSVLNFLFFTEVRKIYVLFVRGAAKNLCVIWAGGQLDPDGVNTGLMWSGGERRAVMPS